VATVLGHATLPQITFGEIGFDGASVAVLPEIPDVFGRPVVGILGIDLLRRAQVIRLGFGAADQPGRLELQPASTATEHRGIEVPFSLVNSHLMVGARVNDEPVSFIVDTGAPEPFLDAQAARAAGVAKRRDSAQDVRGLGEGSAQAHRGTMRTLSLGACEHADISTWISALPVFAPLRVHGQSVGLLGNEFFARFGGVEIDFERGVLRLRPDAQPHGAAR
jgi:predicted aspartyl protease